MIHVLILLAGYILGVFSLAFLATRKTVLIKTSQKDMDSIMNNLEDICNIYNTTMSHDDNDMIKIHIIKYVLERTGKVQAKLLLISSKAQSKKIKVATKTVSRITEQCSSDLLKIRVKEKE